MPSDQSVAMLRGGSQVPEEWGEVGERRKPEDGRMDPPSIGKGVASRSSAGAPKSRVSQSAWAVAGVEGGRKGVLPASEGSSPPPKKHCHRLISGNAEGKTVVEKEDRQPLRRGGQRARAREAVREHCHPIDQWQCGRNERTRVADSRRRGGKREDPKNLRSQKRSK